MLSDSSALLVVGTSLEVYSIFRFIKAAHEQKKDIAIMNIGKTRGDQIANMKWEANLSNGLKEVYQILQNS
jgi:NAD-dependent deacetylase sirtuin 4